MRAKRSLIYGGLALLALLATAAFVVAAGEAPSVAADDSASEATAVRLSAPAAEANLQAGDQALPVDNTVATVDLEAGFVLDPYLLRVMGSGDTAASEIQEGCAGFVNSEPDVVLNWSGDSEALHLFTYSDTDPVLVVETPDGDFLCNDDADDVVVDPLVTLENPAEGTYNIHVGSFFADEPALGFLVITELEVSDDLATIDLGPILDRQEYRDLELLLPEVDVSDLALGDSGVFGDDELEPGFEAIEVFAAGGGDLAVASLDGLDADCVGFASLVPTYSFTWSGGGSLSVYFESEEDSSLIVVTPDEIICNDNAADDNLNPAVDILGAAEGSYDVFIGAQTPNTVVTGTLVITSDTGAEPAALSPGS